MKISSSRSILSKVAFVFAAALLFVSTSRAAHPLVVPPSTNAPVPVKNPLVWDAIDKTVVPKVGAGEAEFTFWVTNTSATDEVVINELHPACGCTVPQTKVPWKLAPGTNGPVK